MTINLKGVFAIVGNYGSGKTEVTINLAVDSRQRGIDVRIADLDLVNPYFRSREARSALEALGIDVVLPPDRYMHADLPILSPHVSGLIRNPSPLTLLDSGGDDVGATVLSSLHDVLTDQNATLVQVINPFRPYTDTVAGCTVIRRQIEAAARLPIGALVGNANLIDDTTIEDLRFGHQFAVRAAEEMGLPLLFVTANADLLPQLDLDCPVLPIRRQMVPPWKQAAVLPTTGFGKEFN